MSAHTFHSDYITHHTVTPEDVRRTLEKNMLVDGFTDFVLDYRNSSGSYLRDAITGDDYLDFFTFFASNALGMNHPKMLDEEFLDKLSHAALHKPSNSDMYTEAMAEFVDHFSTYATPPDFKYLFFVEGGSVAVENALKVAFDWKVRKNKAKGHAGEKGSKIIHFREAFHGRTGYALSMTNTDPNKIAYFPKFEWPRISNPMVTFPVRDNLQGIINSEEMALREIHTALEKERDEIAAIIIEPIQCEGGDNHFRGEFLQKLRQIADENELLLIFDEVQTGFGITGKWWCAEHYVMPDIIVFGKKVQVCGMMVSGRIDDVEEHCFRKSSRINSTWGGNLTDMVRAARIIQIMAEDNIVENASIIGRYLLNRLYELQEEFPALISNTRGLGLLCSFDLPSTDVRKVFLDELYKNKMFMLGCGPKTVRFRTALNVNRDIIDAGLKIIRNSLNSINK